MLGRNPAVCREQNAVTATRTQPATVSWSVYPICAYRRRPQHQGRTPAPAARRPKTVETPQIAEMAASCSVPEVILSEGARAAGTRTRAGCGVKLGSSGLALTQTRVAHRVVPARNWRAAGVEARTPAP